MNYKWLTCSMNSSWDWESNTLLHRPKPSKPWKHSTWITMEWLIKNNCSTRSSLWWAHRNLSKCMFRIHTTRITLMITLMTISARICTVLARITWNSKLKCTEIRFEAKYTICSNYNTCSLRWFFQFLFLDRYNIIKNLPKEFYFILIIIKLSDIN